MKHDEKCYHDMCEAAETRAKDVSKKLMSTWRHFMAGNPLAAENEGVRFNPAINRSQLQVRTATQPSGREGAEASKGPRDNFMPVSFLSNGVAISRSVARVHARATGQVGTGFLCAPGLFITNAHVLETKEIARSALVEFDYVEDDRVEPTIFRLDPERCFVTDVVSERDYTIVAIGDRQSGASNLKEFGWCPMSDAGNKHALGEFANIIQHPEGREKQVVLQDNLIAARSDFALHYFADTEEGSSGAPVFNNHWQVIALHHWGTEFHDIEAEHYYHPSSVNEGIRISGIVKHAAGQRNGLNNTARQLVDDMLHLGNTVLPRDVTELVEARDPDAWSVQTEHRAEGSNVHANSTGGQTTWQIPLQITVSIPGHEPVSHSSGSASTQTDTIHPSVTENAEAGLPREGEGYRADFLDHNLVELPALRSGSRDRVRLLTHPERYPSAKPGELQFTHFSTMLDRERKIPIFGACNVDGKSLFGISSTSRKLRDYADQDEKDLRARFDDEGAEGAHSWRPDSRIHQSNQTVEKWYTGKNSLIPREGTDDADRYIAIADFDRGHIVRRVEPIWGSDQAGKEANRQTYNHANAAPQTVKFNQSKDRPSSGVADGEEKRSWYGMEVAILRAAHDDNKKICVFSGPIFLDTDPIYGPGRAGGGNRQVPMSYWKIAVWEDGSKLKSVAMKYSQEWSLLKTGAESADGREALDDADQLYLLRDFLTTIADIEERTDLNFVSGVWPPHFFAGWFVAVLFCF